MSALPFRTGRALLAVTAATAVGALSGCGADAPDLAVENATVRVPANPDVTAGYLTIENSGGTDDTLTRVRSDAAEEVQMHDTTNKDGQMRMAEREDVAVPAGETVEFASGGLHLMLMGPDELRAGDTVRLTLEFEKSGSVRTDAEVRTAAESGG